MTEKPISFEVEALALRKALETGVLKIEDLAGIILPPALYGVIEDFINLKSPSALAEGCSGITIFSIDNCIISNKGNPYDNR